jgi:hypothetical protein
MEFIRRRDNLDRDYKKTYLGNNIYFPFRTAPSGWLANPYTIRLIGSLFMCDLLSYTMVRPRQIHDLVDVLFNPGGVLRYYRIHLLRQTIPG